MENAKGKVRNQTSTVRLVPKEKEREMKREPACNKNRLVPDVQGMEETKKQTSAEHQSRAVRSHYSFIPLFSGS